MNPTPHTETTAAIDAPDKTSSPVELKGLDVNDGKIIMQIIDRVIESGALKGPEALPVGLVRRKVLAALSNSGQ